MKRSRPSAERRGAHWLGTPNTNRQILSRLPEGVIHRPPLGRQWAVERGPGDLFGASASRDRIGCVLHTVPRDDEDAETPAGDAARRHFNDLRQSGWSSNSALVPRRGGVPGW